MKLVETLVHRQNLTELQNKLAQLHPADVAHILEALPLEDRLTVWELVKTDSEGDILLEVSDACARNAAGNDGQTTRSSPLPETLDADEIADLAQDLPREVVHELMDSLEEEEREQLQSALS
jgi:magnesium transporter